MADKSTFTPEEWKKLLGGVMLAGIAVSAAAPSGLWGMFKESLASGSALMGAKSDPNANALVRAVAAEFETSEGRTAAREQLNAMVSGAGGAAEVQARAVEALKQISAIINVKAGGDAAGFKAWLQTIGERTAEASTEGGFLGFGGVAVSDAEKAALEQIAKAMNG